MYFAGVLYGRKHEQERGENMSKTERILRLCADTMKMPGWNDALSMMTDKLSANELSDELLGDVAGGTSKPKTPDNSCLSFTDK